MGIKIIDRIFKLLGFRYNIPDMPNIPPSPIVEVRPENIKVLLNAFNCPSCSWPLSQYTYYVTCGQYKCELYGKKFKWPFVELERVEAETETETETETCYKMGKAIIKRK